MPLFRKRDTAGRAVELVDKRDPTAATKSLRWVNTDRAQPPDWDAATAFALAYYTNVVVYRCVQLYADVISGLPFRVGSDPNKPNDYDPRAPLAKLLGPPPGGPAPKLSARRLWAWTVAQRLVTGRNGWEIETPVGSGTDGTPVALWPLASSSLMPKLSEGGTQWFTGFVYGRAGDTRNLRVDQVCYDWTPSGLDFRQPESPLQAAHLDVAVAVMQSRYDYAFLKNDARPPAIIVTEAFEDEAGFEAFKRQWNTTYGGADNAGRVAFLEASGTAGEGVKGAVDVTVLGISPKDAQAAQRHSAAMERAAMALGVPWSLLDASGRTFSNAGQEWTNWITTRVLPLLADFADMVNMQLAPRLGGNVGWFDVARLKVDEAADPITAQVGAPAMVQAQLMTINEARADYGLPAISGGDRFMTADEILALKSSASPDTASRGTLPPAVREAHVEAREPDASEPLQPAPALAPVDHEARRAKLWTSTSGKIRNLERQWERALRKLFARQARSAVARLEGKRGRTFVARSETRALGDEIFDPSHWLAETVDDVEGLYEAVTAAGGARVSDLFGLAFDLEAPYAQDFIAAQANRLAGQVTDTTYQAIQATLSEGVAAGESIPELAGRVRHVFDVANQSRATLIARTEVVGAFNGAATLTATQYGPDVVAGKEWIATRDSRTREEHRELDGDIVGVTEAFDNGLHYPGEPNCRCTVAFLTPDEMEARTGRSRVVELRVARTVLALVGPDTTEAAIRAALRVAA